MKSASSSLVSLLQSRDFVYCDLYTFTLVGGAVIRLSGGDRLVKANAAGELVTSGGAFVVTAGGDHIGVLTGSGEVFPLGCPIFDGGVQAKIGVSADPVQITILGDDTVSFFNDISLQAFLRTNGLNGAAIRIDRAYSPSWDLLAAIGPTGTINRFSGMFGAVSSLSRTQAVIEAQPMTYLLNVNLPPNVYQASCLHALFDTGCALNRASFAVSVTTASGSSTTLVKSGAGNPAGYFDLGKIVFTSGANSGLQRTVKSYAGGNFTLVLPLPAVPAVGDTFTAYPGCDLSQSTCSSKFSNLAHFRGFPFIPPPETAI